MGLASVKLILYFSPAHDLFIALTYVLLIEIQNQLLNVLNIINISNRKDIWL